MGLFAERPVSKSGAVSIIPAWQTPDEVYFGALGQDQPLAA